LDVRSNKKKISYIENGRKENNIISPKINLNKITDYEDKKNNNYACHKD